jgi:predicted DNA-binding protein (UPF0251 family)
LVPNREFYRQKSNFNREEILFSLYYFSKNHTVLESVILYLKDQRKLNYHQIGALINRDERNIRVLYLRAKIKPIKFYNSSKILIPISIFADKKLSALESLTVYLHDKLNFRFSQIAQLIGRDQRTVWTSYSRARRKNAK